MGDAGLHDDYEHVARNENYQELSSLNYALRSSSFSFGTINGQARRSLGEKWRECNPGWEAPKPQNPLILELMSVLRLREVKDISCGLGRRPISVCRRCLAAGWFPLGLCICIRAFPICLPKSSCICSSPLCSLQWLAMSPLDMGMSRR